MAEALLELHHLHKSFGALRVTDDVCLALAPGSIHAVIGPNGAGKTTLIQQIHGALRPDSGRISLAGHDITALAPHRRARRGLGRSFQIISVLAEFSLLENICLAVRGARPGRLGLFRPLGGDHALAETAMAVLDRVGLADRAAALAGRLSHGEQRRLELALVLAGRPLVMLLDEPLAGAGPEEADRLVGLLAALRADCAILLVEHDMDAVFRLADQISVLAQGRVIASGTPDAIRADPAVRAAYLGEAG